MKKTKIKRPLWKDDNSEKTLKKLYPDSTASFRKKRVSENNKIAKFLRKNGWEYWDSARIVEHGYTLTFKKWGELPQNRPIMFSWHWDNNGGNDFYVGEMWAAFDLYPKDKYWHPYHQFEISPILPRFIKDLWQFECLVIAAARTQTELTAK